MLQSFRYLLFPFALLYGIVLRIRNYFYDKKILSTTEFNFPLICVGNLAIGGTGKSPMVEEIVRLLHNEKKVAVLSRGYMRKTKGYVVAQRESTAIEIGDEPMQLFKKFPDLVVAVAEERLIGIPQILHQYPETKVIVLDDAMQHRKVRAGLTILLTEYSNLYTRDYLFPVGDLRDEKSSSKRAELIIVTKCPQMLKKDEANKIAKEIKQNNNQKVFFTSFQYDQPRHLFTNEIISLHEEHQILLLTGIANPEPLKQFLNDKVSSFDMLRYRDHHIFSMQDLVDIKTNFEKIKSQHKLIITTEKDAVRLEKFGKELEGYPIYVLPVRHQFMNESISEFEQILFTYVNSYVTPVKNKA